MATETLTRNSSEMYLNEIIHLQLKKPKNWGWELSTSKSSPHIVLPTIKLYNSRGKLLVEAKDNNYQRRSWHSSDGKTTNRNINNKLECNTDFNLRKLRKSKSENFQNENNLYKPAGAIESNSLDVIKQDSNNSSDKRNLNPLQKSRSDMLLRRNSRNPLRKNRSARDLFYNMHRSDKSDDAFQRLMKYNEESIKRAITDGYRNFITPFVPHKSITEVEEDIHNKQRKKKSEECIYYMTLPDDEIEQRTNYFTHKRYQTRTCSAGTLVITEESCKYPRRRRKTNDDDISQDQNVNLVKILKQQIKNDKCNDSNSENSYMVQEPITPSSDINNETISEQTLQRKTRKKQHREIKRRTSKNEHKFKAQRSPTKRGLVDRVKSISEDTSAETHF